MNAPARFFAVLTTCLALLPTSTHAAKLQIYQVLTPVTDQSETTRLNGLRTALGTVLVRVTGNGRADAQAETQPILNRAATLAQGFGFEKVAGQLHLRAVFDAAAVEAAIREAGLPIWSAHRPDHVLWVAFEDGSAQPISRSDSVRVQALLDAADRRGLSLVLPHGDDADRAALTFDALWRGLPQPIFAASQRYGAEKALAVRVYREGRGWAAHWWLISAGGLQQEWISGADRIETALDQGVQRLADDLAHQFAVRAGGTARELRIAVSDIRSLAAYGRTLNFLKNLSLMKSVTVERAEGKTVIFRLQTDSEEGSVARVLAADGPLRETGDTFGGARGFRYVP